MPDLKQSDFDAYQTTIVDKKSSAKLTIFYTI